MTPAGKRKRTSTHRSPARFAARMLPGARPRQFPGFIAPYNPTLKSVVPTGERWLLQIKHDGYRIQAHLVEGMPALLTSSGLNWTGRLRSLVAPLKELPPPPTAFPSRRSMSARSAPASAARSCALHRVLASLVTPYWHTLLQRCGGCPLPVHLAKQWGPFPFLAMKCTSPISDAPAENNGLGRAMADPMRQDAMAAAITAAS